MNLHPEHDPTDEVLWDLYYGLLEDDEAERWLRRIDREPDLRERYARVRQGAEKLAAAARWEVAHVQLRAPVEARSPYAVARTRMLAVASALMVLLSLAPWTASPPQPRPSATLSMIGPRDFGDGTSRWRVRLDSADPHATRRPVHYRFFSDADEPLAAGRVELDRRGYADIHATPPPQSARLQVASELSAAPLDWKLRHSQQAPEPQQPSAASPGLEAQLGMQLSVEQRLRELQKAVQPGKPLAESVAELDEFHSFQMGAGGVLRARLGDSPDVAFEDQQYRAGDNVRFYFKALPEPKPETNAGSIAVLANGRFLNAAPTPEVRSLALAYQFTLPRHAESAEVLYVAPPDAARDRIMRWGVPLERGRSQRLRTADLAGADPSLKPLGQAEVAGKATVGFEPSQLRRPRRRRPSP